MMIPTPKRILVVNPNWIGDGLFTFPFLAALRDAYPGAEITCWVVPWCVEFLQGQPFVDDLLVYDERKNRGIFSKWKFITQLRQKKFDAVFLLHRSMTRLLLCTLAGIPKRIGYANWKQRWLLTDPLWPNHGMVGATRRPRPRGQVLKFDFSISVNKKVKFQDLTPQLGSLRFRQEWLQHGKHKVEYFLDLARFAGIKVHRPWYQFHLIERTKKWAQEELAAMGLEGKSFVVIQPGANWELKRWPAGNFTKLLDYFIGEQIPVVVTGSKTDESLIAQVVGRDRRGVCAFYGKNDLEELAAIFQRAALVVTNDTGPMHLASAVGTPVVTLFGPTQPHLTGPYGKGPVRILRKEVGCNEDPCYNLGCKQNVCMQAISVEEVWEAAKELL